jgi:hypothetical protein
LNLPQGEDTRVAFAFVATADSASYLDACQRAQDWYDANTGVAESSLKPQVENLRLEAFPNPATNVLSLYLSTSLAAPASLRMYDTQGRLVHSSFGIRTSTLHLDLQSTPAGIYYLRLTSGDKTVSQRVAVVR